MLYIYKYSIYMLYITYICIKMLYIYIYIK